MLHRFVTALCLLLVAAPCFAGAWPRDKGTAFVTTGYGVLQSPDGTLRSEQTLFLEYGATDKITLGFSGSYMTSTSAEGHLFLRAPLANADRPSVLALDFGLGLTSADMLTTDPFVKTGLSWGRGIEILGKNGWLSLDSAVLWGLGDAGHRLKLDATLGLTLTERIKIMGQSFIELGPTSETITFQPSLVVGSKSGKTHFVVGLEVQAGTSSRQGLRFSLWNRF